MTAPTDRRPDDGPAPAEGSGADGPLTRSDDAQVSSNGLPGGVRLALLVAVVVAVGLMGGWPVLLIVAAILVSILLHELGHFLVARWTGMKVTEFFVGFGPRLWSLRRGEVEYGLKAIPVGAYVRIVGMHSLEEIESADEDRSYRAQSYPKRLAVVLAGPAMNLLIGFVLLLVIFAGFGSQREDRWTVGQVLPGSAAETLGLQPGDRIITMNGEPLANFDSVSGLIGPNAGEPIEIVVERAGQQVQLTGNVGWRLGAAAALQMEPLQPGDQILSVDGRPMATYEQLASTLAGAPEGTVSVEFDRHGYAYKAPVKVPVKLPAGGSDGFLGIGPHVPRVRESPVGAVTSSAKVFGDLVVTSVEGIGHFFSPSGLSKFANLVFSTPPTGHDESTSATTPQVTPVDPGAPTVRPSDASSADENRVLSILGVIRLGSQAADGGAVVFMFLLLTVNIFLALINLVPLLPFDGGHAAVATYEAIRGRIAGHPYRVDMAKLMPITYVVVLLLVGIGLSSMYLDIVSPARNPFTP